MSIRFEVSERVRAAPEQILDTLLDLEGAHRWMPGVIRMERLSSGPLDIGSEWRETRRIFRREATEQFKLTGLDRPRRLELLVDGTKGSSGRGEFLFTYRIERTGDDSEVRLSGEIRGLTGVMGWLGRLFVGAYKKACKKDLTALKSYLEGDMRTGDGGEDEMDSGRGKAAGNP